jgi:hypothetical protein
VLRAIVLAVSLSSLRWSEGSFPSASSFFASSRRPEDNEVFVIIEGIKIAKRGHPGTPQAGT